MSGLTSTSNSPGSSLSTSVAPSTLYPPVGTVQIFSEPIAYQNAWDLQSRLHHERVCSLRPDTMLILEHQSVYTLGRSTKPSHWGENEAALRADGIDLHYVNRGGSVTFHGPGQVVVYPILKLSEHATGPRQFVSMLEEGLLQLLSSWDITGHRIAGKPGIWVMTPELAKIAFIGIRIERGVTLHGVALNVDMDMTPFQRIHPCGFVDCAITSMATVCQTAISIDAVKRELAQIFGTMFHLEWSAAA